MVQVQPQAPPLLSSTETAGRPARTETRTTRAETAIRTRATATTATATATIPRNGRNGHLRGYQQQQPRTLVSNNPSHNSHFSVSKHKHKHETAPSSLPAIRRVVSRVRSTTTSSRGQAHRPSNVVSHAPPLPPQTQIISPWSNLHSTSAPTTRDTTRCCSLRPNTATQTQTATATEVVGPAAKKARFDSSARARTRARAGAGARASAKGASASSYGAAGQKKKTVNGAAGVGGQPLTLDTTAETATSPTSTSRRGRGRATTRLEHIASVDARGKSRGLRSRSPYAAIEQYEAGPGFGGDGAMSSSPADTLKHGSGSGTGTGITSGGSAEKRSLRSHGGASAYKSELAAYFPNYEEIVQLQPAKKEFLGVDTEISVIDDLDLEPGHLNLDEHAMPLQPEFLNPLLNPVDAETVTFTSSTCPPKSSPQSTQPDPLSDELYFKAHRRLERQEKQLRNIERDRAQHEKIQLDRLLEELEGHDWLRTMGISGITDTEKKLYEPKRVYFVQEVSALINKFKKWKEEEKRRRVEREQAAIDRECDEECSSPNHSDLHDGGEESGGEVGDGEEDEEEVHATTNHSRESDVDAMAAHQLHQETLSASSTPHNLKRPKISIRALEAKTRRPHAHTHVHTSSPSAAARPQPQQQHAADGLQSVHNRNLPGPNGPRLSAPSSSLDMHQQQQPSQQPDIAPQQTQTQTPAPPADTKPFTSFYSQPHIRDIALGKTKASRRSRSRLAFGQPVPDLPEQDFELPAGMLTDEAINAAQRKLRRLRRQK